MIPIKNIYYMMAYAFRILDVKGFEKAAVENFENVSDMCAAILISGIERQVKYGLGKGYVEQQGELSTVKGKIDVTNTIRKLSLQRGRVCCGYDEFTINSYMNRIIKTTILQLLKSDAEPKRKTELRRLIAYFMGVDVLDVRLINWNLQYNRNNHSYRLLISICYLVLKELLQTQDMGNTKLINFTDDQRKYRLYEKFVLEYYRKEFPKLDVSSPYIK